VSWRQPAFYERGGEVRRGVREGETSEKGQRESGKGAERQVDIQRPKCVCEEAPFRVKVLVQ
jgi:hypothetical protein